MKYHQRIRYKFFSEFSKGIKLNDFLANIHPRRIKQITFCNSGFGIFYYENMPSCEYCDNPIYKKKWLGMNSSYMTCKNNCHKIHFKEKEDKNE